MSRRTRLSAIRSRLDRLERALPPQESERDRAMRELLESLTLEERLMLFHTLKAAAGKREPPPGWNNPEALAILKRTTAISSGCHDGQG